MRYIIEALHNSCLPPGAAANSTGGEDRSLIHKMLGGRLRSQGGLFVRHIFSSEPQKQLQLLNGIESRIRV
jgi:hypothetical protein